MVVDVAVLRRPGPAPLLVRGGIEQKLDQLGLRHRVPGAHAAAELLELRDGQRAEALARRAFEQRENTFLRRPGHLWRRGEGVGAVVVAVPPAQRVRGLRQRLAPGREQHGTALGPLLGPQRLQLLRRRRVVAGAFAARVLGSRVGFAAEDAAHRAPSL